METKITLFKNPDFGEIRSLMVDNEPWFVLTDVCRTLEIVRGIKVAERVGSLFSVALFDYVFSIGLFLRIMHLHGLFFITILES